MDVLAPVAVALGASWASGFNTYATVLLLGGAQALGFATLPPDLQVLASPWVLGVAGILFVINFLADKIPLVDSINDLLQTIIRVPAGALLAYGAAGQFSPEVAVIAAMLGGTLAAGSHITKTGTRALINTSPEPISNITASLTEDATVAGGLILALFHPIIFLCFLAAFIALLAWLLPRLIRLALGSVRRLTNKSVRQ